MTSKWKILAPVNLSRPAEEDVQYALCVAAALGASLHLLYVVSDDSSSAAALNWPPNALNGLDGHTDVHRIVLQGASASATIAEYADTIDADMVLMTTRTYARWNRFWRKSVTGEVMRISRRPVCIAAARGTDGDFRFRNHRLLCVLGLDNKREAALVRHAREISAKAVADLILLTVVPQPSEALLYRAMDRASRPLSAARAAGELADVACSLPASTTSVMVGDPNKCIGIAAREHAVDLVLVARENGRLPSAYGNDLAAILRKLRCPLLTVPVDAMASVQVIDRSRMSRWLPRVTAAVRR